MKLKKYIFISNGYKGGASTFIIDHINFLDKKKGEITLIDDNPYVTYNKIPKKVKIKKIKTNKFNFQEYRRLKSIIFNNKNKEVIVFITNFAFLIKYFFLIKKFKKFNIKLILTIHSGILNITTKNFFAGLIFSIIYKKVDHLFFGSSSAKKWWKKYYPWMSLDNKCIIYNGIRQKFKKKKLTKSFFSISFAGRMEKENNPAKFLNIAYEYLKLYDDSVFNLYGDGPMLKYLKENNKEKKIKFHGWVKKNKIYRNSNLVIITAPVNNFPYVALEAKSYGIPVISLSRGDVSKIIKNNVDGYVVNSKSIKYIIKLIVNIKKKYYFFSNNAHMRVKLFNYQKSCHNFWDKIL